MSSFDDVSTRRAITLDLQNTSLYFRFGTWAFRDVAAPNKNSNEIYENVKVEIFIVIICDATDCN